MFYVKKQMWLSRRISYLQKKQIGDRCNCIATNCYVVVGSILAMGSWCQMKSQIALHRPKFFFGNQNNLAFRPGPLLPPRADLMAPHLFHWNLSIKAHVSVPRTLRSKKSTTVLSRELIGPKNDYYGTKTLVGFVATHLKYNFDVGHKIRP